MATDQQRYGISVAQVAAELGITLEEARATCELFITEGYFRAVSRDTFGRLIEVQNLPIPPRATLSVPADVLEENMSDQRTGVPDNLAPYMRASIHPTELLGRIAGQVV